MDTEKGTKELAEKDTRELTPTEKRYANLVDIREINAKKTREEVIENCRKGGIASQQKRKERKTLQQMAREMLAIAMDDDQIAEVIGDERLLSNGDGTFDKSVGKVMLARMIQEAQNGNVKAFETVRDTSGEKPTTNVQVETITDGDRALLEKVQARLDKGKS